MGTMLALLCTSAMVSASPMPGVYDIFRPPTATLSPTLTKMVTPEVRKDSTTISRAEYNVEELNNLITNLIVQLQGCHCNGSEDTVKGWADYAATAFSLNISWAVEWMLIASYCVLWSKHLWTILMRVCRHKITPVPNLLPGSAKIAPRSTTSRAEASDNTGSTGMMSSTPIQTKTKDREIRPVSRGRAGEPGVGVYTRYGEDGYLQDHYYEDVRRDDQHTDSFSSLNTSSNSTVVRQVQGCGDGEQQLTVNDGSDERQPVAMDQDALQGGQGGSAKPVDLVWATDEDSNDKEDRAIGGRRPSQLHEGDGGLIKPVDLVWASDEDSHDKDEDRTIGGRRTSQRRSIRPDYYTA